MKVVVTGAAGFIGSHTSEALVSRGHNVVGIDSFDSYLYPADLKRKTAAELAARLPKDSFQLIEADICDEAAMAAVVDESVDTLCHLAALAGVRPSLRAPGKYIRTNLEGTTVLFEQCRRIGLDRVVFASSSSVYGARSFKPGTEPEGFRESDPCLRPASPYAASKRSGELLASTYCDLYGLGITCLRFFTVYGPRQRPDMAIHKFTTAIAKGEAISLYGDGSSRRDYTYIDDIVSGVVAGTERLRPERFAIYNLGGTVTTSLSQLVSFIEEVVGRRAIIQHLPEQPGDVPLTYADISRARLELGYEPKTGVRAGLEQFWQWLQSQRRPIPV